MYNVHKRGESIVTNTMGSELSLQFKNIRRDKLKKDNIEHFKKVL